MVAQATQQRLLTGYRVTFARGVQPTTAQQHATQHATKVGSATTVGNRLMTAKPVLMVGLSKLVCDRSLMDSLELLGIVVGNGVKAAKR